MFELALLLGAAFLAGFVDSAVGGGGLIQLPAAFLYLPSLVPGASSALILGTNKISSVFGTGYAVVRYSTRLPITWRIVLPAAVMAALFSFVGASLVRFFSPQSFESIVLFLLVGVAFVTFRRKKLGTESATQEKFRSFDWLRALGVGISIGFYDGFFGPGTGTFLIFLLVGVFGLDFLRASASAKVVNLVTNVFALVFFVSHDQVAYRVGLPMAVCNVAGSMLGTRLALTRGAPFVRRLFLVVVLAMIARFAVQVFTHW